MSKELRVELTLKSINCKQSNRNCFATLSQRFRPINIYHQRRGDHIMPSLIMEGETGSTQLDNFDMFA